PHDEALVEEHLALLQVIMDIERRRLDRLSPQVGHGRRHHCVPCHALPPGVSSRPTRPRRGLGTYFIAAISRRYFSAPGWKGMGMPFVACSAVISLAEA